MTVPRLEVDLAKVQHNARTLVDLLAPKGIRVTGVTKAALGSPEVGAAMVRGGATGLADSRLENLDRLRAGRLDVPTTLLRSPTLGQAADVVRGVDTSLNTEEATLVALSAAAVEQGTVHRVVLMVELGDLREGILARDVIDAARVVLGLPGLALVGLGTNLACRSGVAPDQRNMDELSGLVARVEATFRTSLTVVSGGNSANLDWALGTHDVGRIDELRLGEAILLGCEPLHRRPLPGLHTDAFTLVAEVIESRTKPSQPWGTIGEAAFGPPSPRTGRADGDVRQVILALGRQDVDPDGLVLPDGLRLLGASSDHLVLDAGDIVCPVGTEVRFGLGYGALVRAMTSPFVATHHPTDLSV